MARPTAVIAAEEPDAHHDSCHGRKIAPQQARRAWFARSALAACLCLSGEDGCMAARVRESSVSGVPELQVPAGRCSGDAPATAGPRGPRVGVLVEDELNQPAPANPLSGPIERSDRSE